MQHMRKISIISLLICVLAFIGWLFIAIMYCILNDMPQKLPYKLTLPLGIIVSVLLLSVISLVISEREYIINEIKKIL
jgi:uncharacterized protein with PQ loop repeat